MLFGSSVELISFISKEVVVYSGAKPISLFQPTVNPSRVKSLK